MKNKNAICRIVTRPNVETGKVELLLGVNKGVLKAGIIYEIEEILGVLTLKEIGKTSVTQNRQDTNNYSICWGNLAGEIIENGSHLLTEEEFEIMCRSTKKD